MNSNGWSIDSLVNYLHNQSKEQINIDIKANDPEKHILKYTQFGSISSIPKRNFNKYYLKKQISKHFPFLISLKNKQIWRK